LAILPLLGFLALPHTIVFHHPNEFSTDLPSSIVSHHLLSPISAPKGNARPAKDNVISAKVASLRFPNLHGSHHPFLFVVIHSNLTESPMTTELSDDLALQTELTPLHLAET
jgi:hypothetical protein